MSAREVTEWHILAEFDRDMRQLVADKVPPEVAAEMVLAVREDRDDDGGAL